MSARGKVLRAFYERRLGGDTDPITCVELEAATGIDRTTLSSLLRRMVDAGVLCRINGVGPRGGYGYNVLAG